MHLNLHDKNIHYVEHGIQYKSNGTLLFLHGWGLSHRVFLPVAKKLQHRFHVVSLDLPGFGDSDIPIGFWGYEAYAQLIVQFLDAIDVKKAHLIGQSTGGGIALATAACFPEKVLSLVLVNSTGIPMKKLPSIPKRIVEIAQQYWHSGFRRENNLIIADMTRNAWRSVSHLLSSVALPIKHDLRYLLSKIKSPTLFVWGKNDDMLPVEHAHEFQTHLPHSKLEIIETGHHEWCFVYPELFTAMLDQFYDNLPHPRHD